MARMHTVASLILVLIVSLARAQNQSTTPFNLDLRFSISLPGDSLRNELRARNNDFPTLFSSSIVATPEKNKRIRRQNVFIGSPTLKLKSNRTLTTGSVFKCSLDSTIENLSPRCEEIQLKNEYTSMFYDENRSKSLVGFTLGRTTSDVIACAPLHIGDNDTPEGLCFVLEAMTGQPLKAFKYNMRQYFVNQRPFDSHNMFGFSYAYNHIADEFLLGMPGHADFTGSVVTVTNELDVRLTSIVLNRSDTYFAYALAFSAYTNDEIQAIIASWPKFNQFAGKVDLIDYSTGSVVSSIFGGNDALGECFGASLLVSDVNNDQRGDLFVGAPLYSNVVRRELGRVYWFRGLSFQALRRQQPQIIMARNGKSGSRFGTSLATIDLNQDTFADILISAPFEESSSPSSSGAIYIYYGSANGLEIGNEKRIEGKDLSASKNMLGFGYSLWTSNDVDNNGYSDVIVGSLISESVSILRSIPIIRLNLSLTFDREGINFSDASSCPPGAFTCFRVAFCVLTNAREPFRQDVSYHVELSVTDRKLRLKESRVKLVKQAMNLKSRLTRVCLPPKDGFVVEVKDKEEISDIMTPIEVELDVTLINFNEKGSKFCAHCPMASPATIYDEIEFKHGCAKKQCEALLNLKVALRYGPNELSDTLVQGEHPSIDATVRVNNQGESSIDTLLVIQMRPFTLQLIENADSRRCRSDAVLNRYLCDVNRLLHTNQTEELILRLDTSEIASKKLSIHFSLESQSVIRRESVTSRKVDFEISKEASFQLEETHSLSAANDSFSEQIPRKTFTLRFDIKKSGPSAVNYTVLELYMPSGVIDIDQAYPSKCSHAGFAKAKLSNSHLANETLTANCDVDSDFCSKWECNVQGRWPSNYRSTSLEMTLAFYPKKIPSQLKYVYFMFTIKSYLRTSDIFMPNALLAQSQAEFIFEKQSTQIKPTASPLIMFGGAGVGLLLLLLTTIVLMKKGFFRRKKKEELMRMKQRMSMSPNMFANVNLD